MDDKTKKLLTSIVDSSPFRLPIPTTWIEYIPGDEVPKGVLLLVILVQQTEEGDTLLSPVLCEYNAKINAFIDVDGVAIEAEATVSHYHVVHFPNGEVLNI